MTTVVEPLAELIREHDLFPEQAESLAAQVEDWTDERLGGNRSLTRRRRRTRRRRDRHRSSDDDRPTAWTGLVSWRRGGR